MLVPWSGLGNVPGLENAGTNFIGIDRSVKHVAARHSSDIRPKLLDAFADDPRRNGMSFWLISVFGAVGDIA